MTALKSKLYNLAVNANQWFLHGRTWVLLPFTVMSFSAYVAVLMDFFVIPKDPLLLGTITLGFGFSIVLFGKLSNKYGGTSVDKMTIHWQDPFHTIAGIAEFSASCIILRDKGESIPKCFHEWGIDKWEDILLITEYYLDRGKKSHALPLIKKFMEKQKAMIEANRLDIALTETGFREGPPSIWDVSPRNKKEEK